MARSFTMQIELPLGLIKNADYKLTAYCDDRPPGIEIDCLIIHCISLPKGQFGTPYIDSLFCGQLQNNCPTELAYLLPLRVSAHLLIRRTGVVTQFVPFSKRAWHAGESFFQGKNHCNDFSIGIELEGTDDTPYEPAQYEQLVKVTRALLQNYPKLTLDRIIGHSDISPTRKTDPGACFDWPLYKRAL